MQNRNIWSLHRKMCTVMCSAAMYLYRVAPRDEKENDVKDVYQMTFLIHFTSCYLFIVIKQTNKYIRHRLYFFNWHISLAKKQ